jgi:hypothetical protein
MPVLMRALFYVEFIAIGGTLVGAMFMYQKLDGGPEILMIFMSILAVVYFLKSYDRVSSAGDSAPRGFIDLLALTIIPKTSGIACAVGINGVLFSILKLNGAMEMLMIGTTVLSVAVVLSLIFILTRPNSSGHLVQWLYRSVPILLISAYFFYGSTPPTS